MAEMHVGLSDERQYTVTDDITAAAVFVHNYPETVRMPAVWSTPDMIGKMEVVAAGMIAPFLDGGQITVGARNEVSHLAATPTGMTVRVRATLTAVEGRKLTFAVEAFDPKEKVGEGIHIRYIVDRARFESRVAEKRP
jgi:fluoroacetyl-CoA thioesterase